MRLFKKLGVALALSAMAMAGAAHAQKQDPLKIGFITTLSTPAGYIGEDERDGFMLAVKQEQGKLGGVPVDVIIEDDGLKPGSGKQTAERMLQQGVKLFTGINFSNVLVAVAPAVFREDAFYVSLNAGPSNFAGEGCDKNYFAAAFQNDSYSDTAAIAANNMGIKKMVIMAPNYQSGRDALNGFKRAYKGEILAEIYTKLDQSDFSVELARIRSLAPEALFEFLPGGAGINFAKQWANSGLNDTVKMVTTLYSMDDRMLAATGDASEGFLLTTEWTADVDNAANKQFVEAFQKEYGRRPTVYAATSYDTARLMASALKVVDGDIVGKADQFRDALRKAEFDSVRGKFKLGPNHYPIQDWFLVEVARNDAGKLDYKFVETIVQDHGDAYSHLCKMDK